MVIELREKVKSGNYILKDLAKEYDITYGHLWNIVNYKSWDDIE